MPTGKFLKEHRHRILFPHANREDHYRITGDCYKSQAISGRCLDQCRAPGRGDETFGFICARRPTISLQCRAPVRGDETGDLDRDLFLTDPSMSRPGSGR